MCHIKTFWQVIIKGQMKSFFFFFIIIIIIVYF